MKTWQKYCAGLAALAGFAPGIRADINGAVTLAGQAVVAQLNGAVPAAPAAVPAAAAPAAAQPTTLWSFLGLGPDKLASCKARLCASPLGNVLNNGGAPFRMISGGIIPPLCPPPSIADLDKMIKDAPAGGAEAVAAEVKKEEAQAAAKIAALRFLGSVDCHYFPEAGGALIGGLRQERIECVRYEAALALQKGCCCNKKTMDALVISASASDEDGFAAETSDRVKAAALTALEHCLACYTEASKAKAKPILPPEAPGKPTTPPKPAESPANGRQAQMQDGGNHLHLTAYEIRLERQSMEDVVAKARRLVSNPLRETSAGTTLASGNRGLGNLLSHAVFGGSTTVEMTSEATVIPTAPPPEVHKIILTSTNPGTAIPERVPSVQHAVYPTVATKTVVEAPATVVATTAVPRARTPAPASKCYQLMKVLQESSNPFQREWAALTLAEVDWQAHPEVVMLLVKTAKSDSANAVRIQCLRTLAKRKVNTTLVVNVMQELKMDRDPQVKREADMALARMGI